MSHQLALRASLPVVVCLLISSGCAGTPGGGGNGNTGNGTGSGLVVFSDPDSTFETSDVYDVDEAIVQFDAGTLAIIWKADGTVFQEGMWPTDGNSLGATGGFQVRFGNVSGQRRAFFTESLSGYIYDFVVTGGNLNIFSTSVPVPQ